MTAFCTFLVAVLSVLVTVLIGWNIYNVVDFKKHIEKMEVRIKELEKALDGKMDKKNMVPPDISQKGKAGAPSDSE